MKAHPGSVSRDRLAWTDERAKRAKIAVSGLRPSLAGRRRGPDRPYIFGQTFTFRSDAVHLSAHVNRSTLRNRRARIFLFFLSYFSPAGARPPVKCRNVFAPN